MDPLVQFLRHDKEDRDKAIQALFISLGYHLSSHKETINKIMDYANKEIEKNG
ncbi:MAG: hypothetical protein PHW63_09845 [Alphaproteobacteria bacterium]|nr:hypothetical protein [Alphaproteobacteria bacterium]